MAGSREGDCRWRFNRTRSIHCILTMENTLHPVRHFYRQYLARYAWARKVKTVVLRAWFSNRHVLHVTAWHLRHSIHKMIYMLSQRLRVFGHAAMRLAHRLNEQAAH